MKQFQKHRTLFIALFSLALIQAQDKDKEVLNQLLDHWHKDAADANYEGYFGAMAEESIFIGTDATENWTKKEFQDFAKPYFDRGRAWSFTAIDRNIYVQKKGGVAWFDELLSTQMGICRGSGILIKKRGKWHIKHYVLSIDVPNDNVNELTALKQKRDSTFIADRRKIR